MKEFFDAIKAGDTGTVSARVAADPSLLGSRDETGLGAYLAAKYSRKEETAQWLLEHGVPLDVFGAAVAGATERLIGIVSVSPANVDVHSHDGWTPLHLAAFFGHAEAAAALLAHGAAVNARSSNAMRNTPIHAAAATRSLEVVRVLAEHHADVSARQHGGWTALHAAAQNGDLDMARLLIALGADVQARAENNQGPLDMALTAGHQSMVELLEEHGAR